MAKKDYDWQNGAALELHTEKKHKILREYFTQYLLTRCNPPSRSFKLLLVDGFAGAGRYKGGEPGSPLIFLEVLQEVAVNINIYRESQNLPAMIIECNLCVNDADKNVLHLLRGNMQPLLDQIDDIADLTVTTSYFNFPFDEFYVRSKPHMLRTKIRNVFFNLDQCGTAQVNNTILSDIIESWHSAEILYTFVISSLLTYLSPKKTNTTILSPALQGQINDLTIEYENAQYNKDEWLGRAEKTIFEYLKRTADYVSPFSINNPDGWRYWLMHFASSYRARQVFNDVLHQEFTTQAHYGRSGLRMLAYEPSEEMQIYMFDDIGRESAKHELYDDIPRVISGHGNSLPMEEFYKHAYNETPAHSDDIHQMMIDNPDVEVLTKGGKPRRKPHTIDKTDRLQLKQQCSFFFPSHSLDK